MSAVQQQLGVQPVGPGVGGAIMAPWATQPDWQCTLFTLWMRQYLHRLDMIIGNAIQKALMGSFHDHTVPLHRSRSCQTSS